MSGIVDENVAVNVRYTPRPPATPKPTGGVVRKHVVYSMSARTGEVIPVKRTVRFTADTKEHDGNTAKIFGGANTYDERRVAGLMAALKEPALFEEWILQTHEILILNDIKTLFAKALQHSPGLNPTLITIMAKAEPIIVALKQRQRDDEMLPDDIKAIGVIRRCIEACIAPRQAPGESRDTSTSARRCRR